MCSQRILDKLLTKITKFTIPVPNKDFSNFKSAMISMEVYLEELKSEHKLDFTQGNAERLLAHIVHHAIPATILDEYRNLLSKSFPSLNDFFVNVNTIVTKLQDKSELHVKTKSSQHESSITSTIPVENVNTIKSQKPRDGKFSRPKVCLFCGSANHISSFCSQFVTVESRRKAYADRHKKDGCKKCILEHKHSKECAPCQTRDCTDVKSHGSLACPIKISLAKAKNSKLSIQSLLINRILMSML